MIAAPPKPARPTINVARPEPHSSTSFSHERPNHNRNSEENNGDRYSGLGFVAEELEFESGNMRGRAIEFRHIGRECIFPRRLGEIERLFRNPPRIGLAIEEVIDFRPDARFAPEFI